MKRSILAIGLCLVGGAAAADPAEGVWKTKPDDNGNFGHIQIQTCGDRICGTLIRSFHGDGSDFASDNIGKQIIWDMKPEGDGHYDGGKVWAPDRDKTYSSKMQLSGDSLAIEGCVLFICRDGGTWTRVK